jgi:hypothetical protein
MTRTIDSFIATAYPERYWHISDAKFRHIERSCDIRLNWPLKKKLFRIQMLHLHHATLQDAAPRASEVKGLTEAVLEAANSLVFLLQTLVIDRDHPHAEMRNPKRYSEKAVDTLNYLLIRNGLPYRRLRQILEVVRALQQPFQLSRDSLDELTTGGAGRSNHPHFEAYVQQLAEVFRTAGGTPSASYNSSYQGTEHVRAGARRGPFVRFVILLAAGLPRSLPSPRSRDAVGEAVRRALKATTTK